MLLLEKKKFSKDPFRYCLTAWHEWSNIQAANCLDYVAELNPTSNELKDPILWLCQAKALSVAAVTLTKSDPDFSSMPSSLISILHRQYFSGALLLVGYSVEVLFKALAINKLGIERYTEKERSYHNHKLTWLVEQHIPVNKKESAVLECLSHFIYWAGKYPDHGKGYEIKAQNVFDLCENNQITYEDIFKTCDRLFNEAARIISN
ncbi:hypothetical protein [Flavobacterium sp. W21_SRS_FM6]|uniref:hypothetical protein n=1 Tax=Flavobacterium sp. W21_SRS_FM6 TaxID=3240268 RepID=UPI003F8E2DA6